MPTANLVENRTKCSRETSPNIDQRNNCGYPQALRKGIGRVLNFGMLKTEWIEEVLGRFVLLWKGRKIELELRETVLPVLDERQTEDLLACYEVWKNSPERLMEALLSYHEN